MKTLSYILLIAAIHGNIALIRRKELTVQQVNNVMGKLIDAGEFDRTTKFSGNISCNEKSFLDCFESIHTFYENELSPKIFLMFSENLAEKLKKYKTGVALLVSEKYNFDTKFRDIINLQDSSMYCVIGALSLHKHKDIKIDDLLNDYTFLAKLSSLSVEDTNDFKLNFINTIKQHMDLEKHKDLDEYKKMFEDEKLNDRNSLTTYFDKLRNEINTYSSEFCELQKELRLSWIKADTWTWSRLTNSIELNDSSTNSSFIMEIDGLEVEFETDILEKTKYTYFNFPLDLPLNEKYPENVDSTKSKTDLTQQGVEKDSFMKEDASPSNDPVDVEEDHRSRKLKSLLDWKLSDFDQNERIKKLPPVKENRDNNFQPITMKSLKKLINERKANPKSITVEKFYHTVSLAVDMIVSKVIFPRILFYGYKAMSIYYDDMKSDTIENKDYRFFQQFYLGEKILIFKYTLEMFYSVQPFTFHKETVLTMLEILDFLVKSYMFHIQKKLEPTDPTESVEKIKNYLKDVRFKQDSVPNISNLSVQNWDEVYEGVNDAVFLMIHLTEIKKQKN